MGQFAWLRFILLVVISSYVRCASVADTETIEADPWENNPEYTDSGLKIHGGDMLYPQDLIDSMTDEMRQAINPNYYKISGKPECLRWEDNTLLYHVESMSSSTFNMLQRAMDLWEAVSCVKFKKADVNAGKAYVKYTDTKSGCYAHVGAICWIPGYNELNLGTGCAYSIGTPAHELGHSLGIYHQQSRSDRDSYVKINFANIQSGRRSNFEKKTTSNTDNFDVAYDYCSVMHYHNTAFTNNGKKTIVHIDPSKASMNFGQRSGLGWGDIKLANRMYQCGKACEAQGRRCPSGCIFKPHDCSTCMCAKPNSGSSCTAYTTSNMPNMVPSIGGTTKPTTTPPPSSSNCDVLLKVGTDSTTHMYSLSNLNTQRQNCIITVETESPKNVRVQVTKFVFNPKAKRRKTCTQNYFQICPNGLLDFTGKKKYCGKSSRKVKVAPVTSSGTALTINANLSGNRAKVFLQLSVAAV